MVHFLDGVIHAACDDQPPLGFAGAFLPYWANVDYPLVPGPWLEGLPPKLTLLGPTYQVRRSGHCHGPGL